MKLREELGKHFVDVALKFGPKELIALVDDLSMSIATKVLDGVGAKGLREMLNELGAPLVERLVASGALTPEQILTLCNLGKAIVEKYSPEMLARVAKLMGDGKVAAVLLKRILEDIPKSAFEETVENLAKDPTGKIAKCYENLGWKLTSMLILDVGYLDVAGAVADVGTSGISEMMCKCNGTQQFSRLFHKYGGAKPLQEALRSVTHANYLEAGTPEPIETPVEAGTEPHPCRARARPHSCRAEPHPRGA